MSTLMEDRLAAALRARADQVQPEDLRPLDVPVRPLRDTRRRRRTAVLGGLAAAAVAAAVAGPLVLGGQDGTRSPQPAGPSEPQPTSATERPLGSLTADIDGDGSNDTVHLVETQLRVRLVVILADGERFEIPVDAAAPEAVLLPVGDLGGTSGDELVVPVSDDASDLPAVYTWLDGEGLVGAPWPEVGLESWRPEHELNRWTVLENGLRTWEAQSVPGDGRYLYWDWTVDEEARLLPGAAQLGCAAPEDAPAPCPREGDGSKGRPDVGAREDLPMLMPGVSERLSGERLVYGPDFFGPGSDDYAQLQGDFTPEDSAGDGHVELVVTTNGVEHRAPVKAGREPLLVPRPLVMHGDAPVFVVERSGGDTLSTSVFSFWNGELVELEPEGDVFLGSGVVDHEGELTEQRTWVTSEGQLFTAVLLDWETRRHHLWRWDVGRTVVPIDLGEACIDWETGNYGRC